MFQEYRKHVPLLYRVYFLGSQIIEAAKYRAVGVVISVCLKVHYLSFRLNQFRQITHTATHLGSKHAHTHMQVAKTPPHNPFSHCQENY